MGLLRTERSDKSSLKWFNLSSGLKVKKKSTMQSIWDRKNNAWNGQSQSKVLCGWSLQSKGKSSRRLERSSLPDQERP